MPDRHTEIDLERAKLSPADAFDRPEDVLAAAISAADKKAILDQWETDAKALARAGDEGMADGEPSLLIDVNSAQKRLREQSPAAATRSQA